jgi:hypothetical protein
MADSQHTPGPWDVRRHDNLYAAVVANEKTICTVPIGEFDADGEANLAVISAVPDLLAALKCVLAIASANAEDLESGDVDPDCERARAAIAKAEGR